MSDENDTNDFLNSESSDDDLEIFLNTPVTKNENYLEETVPQCSDAVFMSHFRISREKTIIIAEKFEESEYYKNHSGQYGALSSLKQILIFLWYIGHQTASFRDVSDRFDITISSLHRIIKRVAVFISNSSRTIISWPTNDEKVVIEQDFRENGFPGVIGAIDGCHIKIDKPENDSESYINRKGFYSIQMRVVCDHTRKIRDVFVGFPGSVHDSRVFRNSPLYDELEEKCRNYYLLGDSGYPLKKNLLTPFKDRGQLTRRQINYNIKLSKNRCVIEHCFGLLKQKFRQLYHIKLRNIAYIAHLIRADCVWHNIALNDGFNEEDFIMDRNDEGLLVIQDFDDDEDEEQDAKIIRNNVASVLRI